MKKLIIALAAVIFAAFSGLAVTASETGSSAPTEAPKIRYLGEINDIEEAERDTVTPVIVIYVAAVGGTAFFAALLIKVKKEKQTDKQKNSPVD